MASLDFHHVHLHLLVESHANAAVVGYVRIAPPAPVKNFGIHVWHF
jgi:hypothetical protein